MSIQEYNKTGKPLIKIGNWEEELAMHASLAETQGSLDTKARIFPNAAGSQYVTSHKDSYRRENHVPVHTATHQRSSLQRADLIAEARIIHAKQKAELEARIQHAQSDGAENPFSHRAPMNRNRVMNFNRAPVHENALRSAAISIYSEDKLRRSNVPLTSETMFAKNTAFSNPIEFYHGNSAWKEE